MTQDECKNLDELIATLVKYHPEPMSSWWKRRITLPKRRTPDNCANRANPIRASADRGRDLAKLMLDAPTIAAGLLHDTVEDCDDVTIEVIEQEFGQEVALLVDGVTKLKRLDFTSRVEQQPNPSAR